MYQWCRLGKRYELPSRTLAAWCVDWHGKRPNWDSTQYTNLFVFLSFFLFFLFFFFLCVCRGVHESVQVGFVPNLRPTRPSRVPNFQTHRQPNRKSDRMRRFLPESGRVSVGVDYLENGENSAKKI